MALFVTRKMDELGRIVLPMELRIKYQIEAGTAIDIREGRNGQIVLQKSKPCCKICGETNGLSEVKNIFICGSCISSIKEMDT